jgi:DNA-binding NarL/FixJ family response regulator
MGQTRRVLIADDRARSRHGLRALLTTYPGIEVVGEAGNGKEALRLVEERQPDAVVMDAKMPGMDGLTATRAIKGRWPEIKVIMLTMYSARRADALGSGADAFLMKGCPPQELLSAILDHEESER